MKSNFLFLNRSSILIQLSFIICLHFLFSFNLSANNQRQELIIEEVYIHTDKSVYMPGEDLWFKAYILDSKSHAPSSFSKLLYLNIIDNKGKIVFSSTYPIKNGLANGDYQLSEKLENGDYQIIAYTENQKELPSSYWYCKKIEVSNRPSDLWNINYEADSRKLAESELVGVIYCKSEDGDPIQNTKLKITISSSENEMYSKSVKTDSLGSYALMWEIPVKDAIEDLKLNIEADFLEESKTLTINIPLSKEGLDLRFYPEGGHMIQGLSNKVAFNATDNYGNPIDIEADLKNQDGDLISQFKSQKDGMGVFIITPQVNETYFVSVIDPVLKEAIYQLPEVLEKGYTLNVQNTNKDNLTVIINMTVNFYGKEIKLALSDGLHSETLVKTILEKQTQIELPITKYPIGISTLTLYSEGIPVAERLVFLNKHKKIKLAVKTNKASYAPREKVELLIEATDLKGNPVAANLSLAVVDAHRVDPKQQNLLASMLLGNQLNKPPKNSSIYLEDTKEADHFLNLLLMIQGWRKIELIQEYTKIYTNSKSSEGIKGKVFIKKKKPAKYAQVQILNTRTWQMISTKTNQDGVFNFPLEEYIEIADQSDLSISAHIPNSNKKLKISIDQQSPKELSLSFKGNQLISPIYNFPEKTDLGSELLAIQKYTEFENNPKKYTNFDSTKFLLSEVAITAKKITKEERVKRMEARVTSTLKGDKTISFQQNSADGNTAFADLLRQIDPFLLQAGGKFFTRGISTFETRRDAGLLIVIDGQKSDISRANELLNQIEDIKITRGAGAGLVYSGGHLGGLVEITLKKMKNPVVTYDYNIKSDENISVIKGFRVARTFKAPNFAVKEDEHANYDNRSSLYWNPNVIIDQQGKASISFYNSDRRCKIQCIIMGVNKDGLMLNHQSTYTVY